MLFIVPIEPIETRYTKHWYKFFPDIFSEKIKCDVVQIEIPYEMVKNDDGGFFNFAKTCVYKSQQAAHIAEMFSKGQIKDNDIFLVTDYWNPQVVSTIRYCSATLGIKVRLAGICHAGYWDNHDILRKSFDKMGLRDYAKMEERTLDLSYDVLFFATEFSKNLYERSIVEEKNCAKRVVTGFPMSYYDRVESVESVEKREKERLVVFPHRIAEEKHPELFDELAIRMPDYQFVKTILVSETKEQYHELLTRAKYSVSFADQETLGISMSIESLNYGVFPVVPNKLSYREMFSDLFKYDENSVDYVSEVENIIRQRDKLSENQIGLLIENEFESIKGRFFDGNKMFETINEMI